MKPSKALNPNINSVEKCNIGLGTLHGWMTILCGSLVWYIQLSKLKNPNPKP